MHISKHSLFLSQDHGRLSIVRFSEHSPFSRRRHSQVHGRLSIVRISVETLKITVGCPPRTYPSIHVETLRITVGCLTSTYPSIRNKSLHTCWTPWSTQETRGLWARPPVLTSVPVQAFHSRACLNLHHCGVRAHDCASFVSSSRNSNRTTTKSSLHARRPSIVDTSKKQKRKFGQKGRLNVRASL